MNKKYYILISLLSFLLLFFITFIIVLAVNGFEPLSVDIAFRDFAYNIRGDKYGFMFWFNRLISELAFIYFIVVLVLLVGFLSKLGLPTLILVAGEATTYVVSTVVKLFCKRERPIAEMRWMAEISPSFPSAHSSTAVFLYTIISYFVIRYSKNKALKIVTPICSVILVLLIGFSRIVLGVHYFTDVLAGYCIGGVCAIGFIIISEILISKNYNFLNRFIKPKTEKN